MWMAEQMEGEVVGRASDYAPAFKDVYRFILRALGGDVFVATDLFQKYLAGEMPQRLLSISPFSVCRRSKRPLMRAVTLAPQLWPLEYKGCGEHT